GEHAEGIAGERPTLAARAAKERLHVPRQVALAKAGEAREAVARARGAVGNEARHLGGVGGGDDVGRVEALAAGRRVAAVWVVVGDERAAAGVAAVLRWHEGVRDGQNSGHGAA